MACAPSVSTIVFLSLLALGLARGAIRNTSGRPFNKIKTAFMGCANAGKTSLAHRLMTGNGLHPNDAVPTIGASFGLAKITDSKGRQGTLEIWDTAGQERYASMLPMYMRGALLLFYVYDITDWRSWESTKDIVANTINHLENDCLVVLLGNKLDAVSNDPEARAVQIEEAENFAMAMAMDAYFEVSAWGADDEFGFGEMRSKVVDEALNHAYNFIPLSTLDPMASAHAEAEHMLRESSQVFRLDREATRQQQSRCQTCALF